MRSQLIAVSIVSVFSFGACGVVEDQSPSGCDADASLCPVSAPTATDVSCDCNCVVGWEGITQTRKFTGAVSLCLPPSLNAQTASPEESEALAKMTAAQYSQNVFKFCSGTVSTYIEDLISEQQRDRNSDVRGVCLGPRLRCSCTTKGTSTESPSCGQPCADVECTSQNCLSLLRRDNTVDASTCACSRVSACGTTTPGLGEAPICTKRLSLHPKPTT